MIRRLGHPLHQVLFNLSKYKLNGDKALYFFKDNSKIASWGLACNRMKHSLNHFQTLINRFKNLDKRKFIFGVFASSLDWDKERIPDSDILKYSAEMSLIMFLKDKRDACLGKSEDSCKCTVCSSTDSEWQSFMDKDNIIVWRREDANHRGEKLYCYKLYGTFDDVTAIDFLEAQVDLDYRLSWDNHAVQLQLLDSEPSTNSDVIYWETKWPTLFSNRDYVFMRRYRIDEERNLLFLVNQNTTHPSKPEVPSKQRVGEYWSYMVIKPKTTFDQPGLEFSLTYFDNPGSNVPSSMMNWVTTSVMPDFLNKLRLAAQGMSKRRGGAPSALRTKMVAKDRQVVVLESLRQTMYLF
ncbi:stAR-related lipid transfer protein 7, mitochondrial-like [Macrosteles quadrilineatus]|uniref:stAR-related lipid transfer protein 7, mitochondrial-like n=1 Tax=Macrosteles quadrilineatus TaxID=74068 RepID=UPI0023E2D2F1|nr:stAR-related lipid transfer protein 7, mitochondrial-like [Macrosteles quadrilineatus]